LADTQLWVRYVIEWELDQTLEIGFVLQAVQRVLSQAQPQIMIRDQGRHFASVRYISLVEAAGVTIGIKGKGRVFDITWREKGSWS
jgi:putative transposase